MSSEIKKTCCWNKLKYQLLWQQWYSQYILHWNLFLYAFFLNIYWRWNSCCNESPIIFYKIKLSNMIMESGKQWGRQSLNSNSRVWASFCLQKNRLNFTITVNLHYKHQQHLISLQWRACPSQNIILCSFCTHVQCSAACRASGLGKRVWGKHLTLTI